MTVHSGPDRNRQVLALVMFGSFIALYVGMQILDSVTPVCPSCGVPDGAPHPMWCPFSYV
jgi:hypothetical protein